MFANVIIYSFLAGLSVIFGVYLVRRFEIWTKKNTVFLMSFAVGLLLANAFLNLLPEAIEKTPNWFFGVLLAIIVFYFLEHFIIIHSCQEEGCEVHALGFTSFLGIGFHSLIDGIIIGVSFGISFSIGLLASLAVILHKTAEGIFTYTLLIHDSKTQKRALIYSWAVALATPFGAILVFLFIQNISQAVLGYLLAAAAGTFIYIGASDLVPETHKKQSFLNIFLVLLGIAFVFIISRFLK